MSVPSEPKHTEIYARATVFQRTLRLKRYAASQTEQSHADLKYLERARRRSL